jgi:ribosome biogenesis ATPase
MYHVCCFVSYLGASEESIRELFAQAKRNAPSIIFIDEIDAIAPKRDDTQRLMEIRIVTQLMISIEKANDDSEASDEPHRHVLVIGATNKPGAIDSSLRRPGRFDREITIAIPDESGREKILTVVTRKQKHDSSVDLRKLATSTSGFVGADLEALANEAGIVVMNRISNEMKLKLSQDLTNEPDEDSWKKPLLPDDDIEKCAITMSDFEVL